jgi:hypothetical protein
MDVAGSYLADESDADKGRQRPDRSGQAHQMVPPPLRPFDVGVRDPFAHDRIVVGRHHAFKWVSP